MFIFIDIENYEGVYGINRRGDVRNNKTGRILKSNYGQPYAYVTPSKNNKTKRLNIHRAVAIAFIPNPENKETVNHINGIKHDNNVTNLEWATRGENEKHAWATGLKTPSKKFLKQVADNGRKYSKAVIGTHKSTGEIVEFPSAKAAARSFDGSQGNITCCCQGKKKTCYGYIWEYKNG
tara:strand:- start:152 stop:688 length:537 start_codon:yes stop_codon:yes gene_type:complete